jgi:hypothetical protein
MRGTGDREAEGTTDQTGVSSTEQSQVGKLACFEFEVLGLFKIKGSGSFTQTISSFQHCFEWGHRRDSLTLISHTICRPAAPGIYSSNTVFSNLAAPGESRFAAPSSESRLAIPGAYSKWGISNGYFR